MNTIHEQNDKIIELLWDTWDKDEFSRIVQMLIFGVKTSVTRQLITEMAITDIKFIDSLENSPIPEDYMKAIFGDGYEF